MTTFLEQMAVAKEQAKEQANRAEADWPLMLRRLQQQQQSVMQENERLADALYRIAEYLNPTEQFKNGQEQTILWITEVVRSVFKTPEPETLFGLPIQYVDTIPEGVIAVAGFREAQSAETER